MNYPIWAFVRVTADCWFFYSPRGWKIAGMAEDWAHNLRFKFSQSSAFDHLAMIYKSWKSNINKITNSVDVKFCMLKNAEPSMSEQLNDILGSVHFTNYSNTSAPRQISKIL